MQNHPKSKNIALALPNHREAPERCFLGTTDQPKAQTTRKINSHTPRITSLVS